MFHLLNIFRIQVEKKWWLFIYSLKNVIDLLFGFVYLFLIGKLLFKMLMVGICFVMNGVSTKLCLISVMWNICSKGFRII